MSMLEWAKQEVAIACKSEEEYGRACYESALQAFETLCNHGHSGFSIKMTQAILNRLIDGKPLRPIEDADDDIWNKCSISHDDEKITYQCKRKSSLFKDIYSDGRIEYHDVDYCYCIDINQPDVTYSSGLVRRIIHEMFPITMPYMPGTPIKVLCEDFLTNSKNGDFDTVGVFYALKEKNGEQEKIVIDRFFRSPEEHETYTTYPGWVEISKEEYDTLKTKAL